MAGRILVLDDEQNYAAMLQELLRQNNYLVDMATKPELALNHLEEVPYDLVISDYKMPVMDGAGFLKQARQLYPNLPIILVSGLMNTPELVKVANMGVTLVLEKPLNSESFLKNVSRFANPMTEEEMELFKMAEQNAASQEVVPCPEEPKFYCGASQRGKSCLLSLWNNCIHNRFVYVYHPVGSDILLALKDISYWKGHRDFPVRQISSADFFGGGLSLAEEILADEESSHILAIELASLDEINETRLLIQQTMSKVMKEDGIFFIFMVSSSIVDKESFLETAGASSVILPELSLRPIDLASYMVRFISLSVKKQNTSKQIVLTEEAIYLAISYDWPENYKQVQKVISKLVEQSDGTIGANEMASALGVSGAVPDASERFASLLQNAQFSLLSDYMMCTGYEAAKLSKSLSLSSSVQSVKDFKNLPLMDNSIAKI